MPRATDGGGLGIERRGQSLGLTVGAWKTDPSPWKALLALAGTQWTVEPRVKNPFSASDVF